MPEMTRYIVMETREVEVLAVTAADAVVVADQILHGRMDATVPIRVTDISAREKY